MTRRLKIEPPSQPTDTAPPTLRRIDRTLRALGPGAPRYDAAILLLCGDACGQNTHRLARFTGIDATFVARCARRLVDNGVWSGGVTLSMWHHPQSGADAFWADVEIALGRARRRVEPNGAMCWERPGDTIVPADAPPPRLIEFVPAMRPRARRTAPSGHPRPDSSHRYRAAGTTPLESWLGPRPSGVIGGCSVTGGSGVDRDRVVLDTLALGPTDRGEIGRDRIDLGPTDRGPTDRGPTDRGEIGRDGTGEVSLIGAAQNSPGHEAPGGAGPSVTRPDPIALNAFPEAIWL